MPGGEEGGGAVLLVLGRATSLLPDGCEQLALWAAALVPGLLEDGLGGGGGLLLLLMAAGCVVAAGGALRQWWWVMDGRRGNFGVLRMVRGEVHNAP